MKRPNVTRAHRAVSALLVLVPAVAMGATAAVPVTVQTFARAESDLYFGNAVRQGGFGKFFHYRTPTPIDAQEVVRMNRDTLYSSAVFDLDAGPVTITLPDPGARFMSMQIISQDHYSPPTVYAPATVTLTREAIGTRYVMAAVRTFVDPKNVADLQATASLQDRISAVQPGGPGRFEIPNWDPATQGRIRDGLAQLQALSSCTTRVRMGSRDEVDPICHLLATATGWGLNPPKDAVYDVRYPKPNTGREVLRLVVRDVPVDAFWSISVYDERGYFAKNALESYSINGVTARRSADGTYAIQFGGCTPQTVNCLVTPAGWSYVVRLYRPRAEILDGSWTFPHPEAVE